MKRLHIFLTVSQGNSGDDAQPLFATSDPTLIAAVVRALENRLRGIRRPTALIREAQDDGVGTMSKE